MRILFVTNNYIPYSGGVVSSIQSTVAQLQEMGNTVHIITLDFLGTEHQDPPHVMRIPSITRFVHNQNHIAVPWRPAQRIQKMCDIVNPDIIHVHHPFLLGPCAVRVARKQGIPVVFTYHTVYEAYAHYVPIPTLFTRQLIKKRVIVFCNKVDHVIAPSSAIAQDIAGAGARRPITVIPSGLRSCFLQNAVSNKQRGHSFNLISVGRFTHEKNIYALLDMFSCLPQDGSYSLTLVGYGVLYDALREYAYTILQLSKERVLFIVKPSQERLVRLYQDADLFVFSSATDTQGLVLAESMSQATPVVALDGPGQQSIIKNGENGFIVPDIAAMKEKVIHIASNPELYTHLQHNARQTAAEYTPEICVQKLVDVYKGLTEIKS
jgi:glycosyltransferase involved in cell wall biosynthesis